MILGRKNIARHPAYFGAECDQRFYQDRRLDRHVQRAHDSCALQRLLTGKFHKNPELLNQRPIVRRMQLKREIQNTKPIVEVLEKTAEKHNVSTSQVALSWVINIHGNAIVAIPGASKVKHAIDNSHAMKFKLTNNEINEINKA